MTHLQSVHKPRNKNTMADESYSVLTHNREDGYMISVKAHQMNARQARAVAAWLLAAADWAEQHEVSV